jgi:hypothetical protein
LLVLVLLLALLQAQLATCLLLVMVLLLALLLAPEQWWNHRCWPHSEQRWKLQSALLLMMPSIPHPHVQKKHICFI